MAVEVACPICIIKPHQQHLGSELSSIFSQGRSIMDYECSFHQILHHQIIPNTIRHFRIDNSNMGVSNLFLHILNPSELVIGAEVWLEMFGKKKNNLPKRKNEPSEC